MKVYVEEIEELSTHGVTQYSLVRGMEVFDAEVRASGITISERDGPELDKEHSLYDSLYQAVKAEVYKEK